MSAKSKAPGKQEKRFAAYLDRLASAAGHADRHEPLKLYCTGLLLPIKRKSVEPMAARLAPDNVRQMHQSLHHLVADAPWDDAALLAEVRQYALGAMESNGPIEAWILDDTRFVKKGTHSVGVARQYCGQVGKPENCRVAVSLSVATAKSSLPVAWRLYLPETWAKDPERRTKAAIPEDVRFQTKPQIALEQIRQAIDDGIAPAPVLGDTAYGNNYKFRHGITELGLRYVLGVQGATTVWQPGQGPLPPKSLGRGRPPTRMRRNKKHQPVSVKQLALSLPHQRWKNVSWREGTSETLRSRFAAVRIRPAHLDHERHSPHPEEWLLVEWPKDASEPARYWLSTLEAHTSLSDLVSQAKQRWIIERDYQELKQELGLGHYEGRGWRGFHHHGTLCIASYGFLVARAEPFFPLCICRACWTIRPQTPQTLQTPRNPGSGPNDITPVRLPRFAFASPVS